MKTELTYRKKTELMNRLEMGDFELMFFLERVIIVRIGEYGLALVDAMPAALVVVWPDAASSLYGRGWALPTIADRVYYHRTFDLYRIIEYKKSKFDVDRVNQDDLAQMIKVYETLVPKV